MRNVVAVIADKAVWLRVRVRFGFGGTVGSRLIAWSMLCGEISTVGPLILAPGCTVRVFATIVVRSSAATPAVNDPLARMVSENGLKSSMKTLLAETAPATVSDALSTSTKSPPVTGKDESVAI